MSTSATAVRFDEHAMWVELSDGRTLGVPLAWFPRLLHACPNSAPRSRSAGTGCIGTRSTRTSRAGLLVGRGDMTRRPEEAA